MFFSPDFLDTLRERAQLSEVVGQKVRLQKQGKQLVGLCPFHKKKHLHFMSVISRAHTIVLDVVPKEISFDF